MDYLKLKKRDTLIGVFVGIIAPVVAAPIVGAILYAQHPVVNADNGMAVAANGFGEYLFHNITHPYKAPIFLSLCVLIDIPLFYLLTRFKKDFVAKGMIYPTLIYAFIVFYLKSGL